MNPETFRERMSYLASTGWPVLSLSEALILLSHGDLPDGTIVLTADDGWDGTVDIGAEILRQHGFPLTNYVTTHYVSKRLPVSNMMLSYLLWKGAKVLSQRDTIDINGNPIACDGSSTVKLRKTLIEMANRLDSLGRDNINDSLASQLEIDYKTLKSKRLFYLMDVDELSRASDKHIDIQLHGDRHLGELTTDDESLFKREVSVNRQKLSRFAKYPLEHFCYPSGAFHTRQVKWLKDLSIQSATTCHPGMNHRSTNQFQLRRFLDREDISLSRFIAEISGIRELLRWRN